MTPDIRVKLRDDWIFSFSPLGISMVELYCHLLGIRVTTSPRSCSFIGFLLCCCAAKWGVREGMSGKWGGGHGGNVREVGGHGGNVREVGGQGGIARVLGGQYCDNEAAP